MVTFSVLLHASAITERSNPICLLPNFICAWYTVVPLTSTAWNEVYTLDIIFWQSADGTYVTSILKPAITLTERTLLYYAYSFHTLIIFLI